MRITDPYARCSELGLLDEGGLSGKALALEQWTAALEAARKAVKGDDGDKSAFELLFEKRSENHELAMLISAEVKAEFAALTEERAATQAGSASAISAYAANATGALPDM